MKKRKTVIVIGAGISGLAAGCYAQMNGYDSKIYEMHSLPGGCCTAWKRNEYVFDPCIEWMSGITPNTTSNRIWRELGALAGKKIKEFDTLNCVKSSDGKCVNFYVDPDRLEAHLKEISPDDKETIEEFCRGVRSCLNISFDVLSEPLKLMSFTRKFKLIFSMLPYLKTFKENEELSITEFVKKIKDPFLREAFRYIIFLDTGYPLLAFYSQLCNGIKRNAGFPEGGSLGVALSIAKRYAELGGKLIYAKKVEKIIVKNDIAVGVRFYDGSEAFADIVISACDGRTVIYDMLDGKYTDSQIETLYKEHLKVPSIFYGATSVFLGVNRDLSKEPHSMTYLLKETEAQQLPAAVDKSIAVQIRTNYFQGFAPHGKSVVYALYLTNYDYWKNLYGNRKAYNEEKAKAADFIIEYLEGIYAGIKSQVEVLDVSTPVTLERYTGQHKGSLMSWSAFSQAEKLAETIIDKGMKLPALRNFYMTGQWTWAAGLPRASALGRYVIQFVCRDDGKEFITFEDGFPLDDRHVSNV